MGSNKRNTIQMQNTELDNMKFNELLNKLKEGFLVTINVDMIMKMQKNKEFWKVCQQADYRVCDSQILLYASRFLRTPIKERISGSDFFPAFCKYHKINFDIKIFLLGAAEGIAEKAKQRINRKVGRHIIIKTHSPSFGFENNEAEIDKIIKLINNSGATVLAIGVGAPKQEIWINRYRHKLPNIKIFMAIGATIDFEAGNVKRSPRWMSRIGLEWMYRLFSEPRRLWKRYLIDDLPFFLLLIKYKLRLYKNPHNE